MSGLKVVGVDILPNGDPGLPEVIISHQRNFFILEAAEPLLNHNVICPSAFPIYTLTESIFPCEVNVLLTCELISLIRFRICVLATLKAFFRALITILVSNIHFRINRRNVHLIHIARCFTSADLISMDFQLRRHLSDTPGGIIRMQMVNDLLAG